MEVNLRRTIEKYMAQNKTHMRSSTPMQSKCKLTSEDGVDIVEKIETVDGMSVSGISGDVLRTAAESRSYFCSPYEITFVPERVHSAWRKAK
jgi:hypothetical protein